MKNSLYHAVLNHDFSENICFLCGDSAEGERGTKEHVFPKWLLNHFGLWDKHIDLINGSKIPYRNLVIPCCKICNNEYLSRIEDQVRDGFLAGAQALKEMDRQVLMIWIVKIFFGLLYRELFLPFDRSQAGLGSIMKKEKMEQYQLIHYLLQSARIPMVFHMDHSDIPASIYVFELQEPENPKLKFDYKDNIVHMTLYLRLGKVGILAAFDMGAQTMEGEGFFAEFQNHPLHPVQFAELGANLFLKAAMFLRAPTAIFAESPTGISFEVLPFGGLRPVFDRWNADDMADVLMLFLGYPREAVLPFPGRVATWLYNEDGSLRHMELDSPPWSS